MDTAVVGNIDVRNPKPKLLLLDEPRWYESRERRATGELLLPIRKKLL